MARARIAAMVATALILVVGATALASPGDVAPAGASAQAVVAWPPSTGLLIAEVVTGGASASDEYVELTNASSVPVDVAGLEVAYVTSSGSTVTRKASWTTALLIHPGRHLLVANASGTFAASADATYTGGFAATGGAIVLRPVGGQPIDAVAWGDASSGFVEGAAAPAPVAGSSIERRPGGAAGSSVDTNDNAADFVANASPIAQNLASAPGPVPSPSPSVVASPSAAPTATPVPTALPTPVATPVATPPPTESPAPTPTAAPTATPTPTPTATPTPSPTQVPTPSPTLAPTLGPTPAPTPTATPTPSPTLMPTPSPTVAPTPAPTPVPTPVPTATPTPEALPVSIDSVRLLPDGADVTVEGVLTTDLGALEAARSGFVQDATGGIAIYLDGAFAAAVPAGSRIRATGTIDSRFGQRTLRVDRADVQVLGEQWLPTPLEVQTGAASEPLEGFRLQLTGTVTETPSSLSDGLGLAIDDGSGEVRVIVGVAALGDAAPARGSIVVARGPLGQRDSSGTGLAGYRLHATLAGEFELLPAPSPSPSPSPSPAPTSTPTTQPSATPSPTSSPTAAPTPTASASPITVAEARLAPVGRTVVVRGVVIAEAGRLGTPALFAIGDATGGIPVKLPDGVPAPTRGALLEVRGALADPYGQTELRPVNGGIVSIGTETIPAPLTLMAGAIGESNEGRLARVTGTVESSAGKSTSNDITFSIKSPDGVTLRVLADASARLDAGLFRKDVGVRLTGVVGQRASRKGALDGYRLWLRDRADVVITTTPAPTPTPTPRSGPTPTPKPSAGIPKPGVMSVRSALLHQGQRVTVEGVLTVNTTLLDASGRRTILEDGTAAIEVYLDGPDASMRLGARVRITGTVGVAWGAPRLRAEETRVLGTRQPAAHALRSAPTAAVEWRLVRVSGTIAEVHRSGDRWTADLQIRGAKVPISGLTGSGIASTDLTEGRAATVTGIVKRPYPTATDRRFALVPRQRSDIMLGKVAPSPGASAAATGGSTGSAAGTPGPGASGASGAVAGISTSATDIDLRDLEAHAGERVRVGGLVTNVQVDGVRLNDGTSEALLVLDGDATDLLGVLQVGDALNATGTPDMRDGPVLVVTNATDVELVGDLGGADPTDAAATPPAAVVPADSPAASSSPVRAVLVPGLGLDSFSSGLGTLILVSLASVAVTLARRQRSQRVQRSRILARLEAIGRGPAPAESAPDRPAEPPFGAQTGPELGGNVRGSA